MPEPVQTQYPIHEQVQPYLTPLGRAEYDAAMARWQTDQVSQQLAAARERVAELESQEGTPDGIPT